MATTGPASDVQYRSWELFGKSIVEWVADSHVPIGEAVLALDATNPLRRKLVRPIGVVTRLAGRWLTRDLTERAILVRQRFEQAVDVLSGELNIAGALVAPLGPWRDDRMCFIAVDKSGEVIAFLKLRWGPSHSDEQEIERSGHELPRLPWLTPYGVPRLLSAVSQADLSVLAVEVPKGRRLAPDWPRFAQALRAQTPRPSGFTRLDSFEWFEAALDRPEIASLRQQLLDHRAGDVGIGPVHGDLRPSNLMETAEGCWILDWETWTADAPWAADILMAASVGGPDGSQLIVGADDGDPISQLDVLAATAFLSTHLQPSVAAQLASNFI